MTPVFRLPALSMAQDAFSALAMERLQLQNPLNTPRGFFKQACLQAAAQRIDEDTEERRRQPALRALGYAMEEGLRFHDLTVIARRFGYAEDFRGTVGGIDHEWGAVAARRLRLVEAYPEKRADVFFALEEGEAEETERLVVSSRAQGLDPEAIARRLDGTTHTGFYRDMRLARAVVQVHGDFFQFRDAWGLASETETRKRHDALRDVYGSFLRATNATYAGTEWDKIFLGSLRNLIWPDRNRPPTPLFRRLKEIQPLVKMELKDESEFVRRATALGLPPQTRVAYYDPRKKVIVFERPSSVNLGTFSLYGRAYVHELRHAADFSESYYAANREGDAASEGQAALTDELWRFLHVGAETFEIMRRLGQGLLHYLLDDYERPWLR